MSTQSTPESAFIESMKETGFYTEWVKTSSLVDKDNYKSFPLRDEDIDKCKEKADKIDFQSGSCVLSGNKSIFIFTVLVNVDFEERRISFTNELGNLLTSLEKAESDLESIAIKKIDEIGFKNVYYLRLVFHR